MVSEDLIDRKIINYLRKQSSNNQNQFEIRNKILSLFFKTIEGIPINLKITNDELNDKFKEFPHYFQTKTREEILDFFNEKVCPKKKINYPYDLYDYDIRENTHLEISPKTFRPLYESDWKTKTEVINNTEFKYQQSFYINYLRYYLQKKEFPSFKQFLIYIYNKYQKPVHKDIKIVFDNIEKSYKPIKDLIKRNNMIYNDVKKTLINSTPISRRIEMQNE